MGKLENIKIKKLRKAQFLKIKIKNVLKFKKKVGKYLKQFIYKKQLQK